MSGTQVSYDPFDYRIHEDPYPTYAWLREHAPVYFTADQELFLVLRGHAVFELDGDPLNALVSQLGRMTPGAQAVVAQLIAQWQAQIAAGVRKMQAAGEVAQDLDADRTAAAMLAGIQGGVVMMMSTGDVTPLEAALDLGIAYLRKNGGAPVSG